MRTTGVAFRRFRRGVMLWGTAVLVILGVRPTRAADTLPPANKRFAVADSDDVPDFQKHIVPLLGRLGCNSAKCHGSFQGQAGFRLSLFGFDFAADLSSLTAAATTEEGRRLSVDAPERSLILLKATETIDHEGGQRFEPNSWEHRLLLSWIRHGAQGVPAPRDTSGRELSADEQFFESRIRPLFETHCYECHGFNNRKGNFQLKSRETILAGGDSGPAIVPGKPNASLLIKAVRQTDADLQMPPSGKLDDKQIADLEEWVRRGAKWPIRPVRTRSAGKTLKRLHYEPSEIHNRKPEEQTSIKVIAEWESGLREDVTCLARFRTNDDGVAVVDRDGVVTAVGPGDTHIVAFYDNGVAAIPVIHPYRIENVASAAAPTKYANPIDKFVGEKLRKLGVEPSARCTDEEFLRRVSIDLTGTLPTPQQVDAFLAAPSDGKREALVDRLLQEPGYPAWWANKLCDFTGCSATAFGDQTGLEVGYGYATQWYDWVHRRVAQNMPYDELVAGIVLAESRRPGQTADEYSAEMSSYVRRESPADFSERPTMPHFWMRDTVSENKDKALAFAHSFLGIQLQCAECHKHPFDRWTQHDFNEFTRFFENVRSRGRMGFPTFAAAQRGNVVRWPELLVDKGTEATVALLRSGDVTVERGMDPRQPIMDWMRRTDNPWFARAFVNRVWAGYFHIGIVEPPDQFTPANPPSNPPLLDWLTAEFVRRKYDMRWLHRQIVTSQTYQRSWQPNETNRNDRRNFSRAIPRRIPAEVLYDAMKQATAASDQLDAVRANLKRRAAGHLSMRMAGTHAMKVFGKPDRALNCDCERVNEPTLLQAVFVQNDPLVRMRLADSGWIAEIEEEGAGTDKQKLVDQIWLRTVNRRPSSSESQRALKHIASVESLAEGIRDLMWALFNTKEFLLNH